MMKIEVKNVTKEYLHGDDHTKAMDNVNFEISGGEFLCVLGRSGSGKTTLMNVMAGLTLPTSGDVLLDGRDIFAMCDREISLYRNEIVGCVPQVSSVLANLTVLDNVRLPFYLAKRKGDPTERARELLKMVGIEKLCNRLPKRLSGGQLKRVAIARAMMNEPKFLLVDEPTADLDAETTVEIMEIFRKLANEGTGVLMITHELETAEYADRLFNMKNGVLEPATKKTSKGKQK